MMIVRIDSIFNIKYISEEEFLKRQKMEVVPQNYRGGEKKIGTTPFWGQGDKKRMS
jgi:hypothetical protein